MSNKQYLNILIMKVGPYCNYSLEKIIEIKQKEQQKIGKFFLGYGGVFCRPNRIREFISYARKNKKSTTVLLVSTSSTYTTSNTERFTHFSTNNTNWNKLPSEVLLVGNKKAPHFAIVAKNLQKNKFELNLNDYCSFKDKAPNMNKYLDKYFRFRVDKACGVYLPKKQRNNEKKIIKVSYTCELASPYSVFIK